MAEADFKPDARTDNPGSREPNRQHAAKKIDMHAHFMEKLTAEPEQPIQGQPPAGQESAEAPAPEQPRHEEPKPTEQTPGSQNAGDEGANQSEETSVEQESKYTTEFVDDDNNIVGYADAEGNEYNVDGTPYVAEGDGEGDGQGEEEPGSAGEVGALQVDGADYTADDVRKLRDSTKELDADYRRKTSVMSRLRQEYETTGQEVTAVGSFFSNLANENLQTYEKMDTREMTPEQFQVYREQYDNAKKGAAQLGQTVNLLKEEVGKRRTKHLDDAAAESREVLVRVEPRWNNEFYAKVRDFAVDSGRYTAEEFPDVTDWRTMEGIVALMDKHGVQKVLSGDNGESETKEPGKRKRRRQRQRQKRNAKGQFSVDTKNTVLGSTNARKDGSLRNHFMAKLANERKD